MSVLSNLSDSLPGQVAPQPCENLFACRQPPTPGIHGDSFPASSTEREQCWSEEFHTLSLWPLYRATPSTVAGMPCYEARSLFLLRTDLMDGMTLATCHLPILLSELTQQAASVVSEANMSSRGIGNSRPSTDLMKSCNFRKSPLRPQQYRTTIKWHKLQWTAILWK